MKNTPIQTRISTAIRFVAAALLMITGLCASDAQAADKKPAFEKADKDFITKVNALYLKDQKASLKAYVTGARKLAKDYPNEIAPVAHLMQATQIMDQPEFAKENAKEKKAILIELVALKNPKFKSFVKQAKGQLWRVSEPLGKPVNIKFKATDGRQVDLAKMKGNVVLVAFWATWCGPCVAEIPRIKGIYAKWHGKGFEVIGISLDSIVGHPRQRISKDQFINYLDESKIPWPTYFDDTDTNYPAIPGQFGVYGIPQMWLINKKGNLVDMDAYERPGFGAVNLAAKVEKLLSEK